MSYVRDQQPATQVPTNISETSGAGPLATSGAAPAYGYAARTRSPVRARLERIGYWIVVLAALGVLLLLLGIFLPKFVGAMFTAFFAGLFVTVLTLMNLPRPSVWGNALLGRSVFPVLRAPSNDIWRLSSVNGLLVFVFTFVFQMVASFVGPFFGGLIVFAALVGAAVFYNRVRSVVIKP